MNEKGNSFHLSFCVTAMFLTILIVAAGIFFVSSLILNQNQSAIAQQQQQPQANLTSAERQKIMEGISFVIDNVTFSHHMASVNDGVQLHYVIGGHGAPVVLIHGFPETSSKLKDRTHSHFLSSALDNYKLGNFSKTLSSS